MDLIAFYLCTALLMIKESPEVPQPPSSPPPPGDNVAFDGDSRMHVGDNRRGASLKQH